MKCILFTFFVIISACSCRAQEKSFGKVYVNGREFGDGGRSFGFTSGDTTLSVSSKAYLNEFGRFYQDNRQAHNRYVIELNAAEWSEKAKEGKRVNSLQLKAVIKYLETNFELDKHDVKARYIELSSICCGSPIEGKVDKRIVKNKKRLKYYGIQR